MTLQDPTDRWSPTQRIEGLTRQVMRLNEQIRDLKEYIQVLHTTNHNLTMDYGEAQRQLKVLQRKWNKAFPPPPKPPKPIPPFETTMEYSRLQVKARREHAWLLRAEGLTYKKVGERLGVGVERARSLVATYARHAHWAARRARWHMSDA
jgi:hypothetical protein